MGMIITGISNLRLSTRSLAEQRYISAWIALWSSEKIAHIEELPSRYPNLVQVNLRTFEFPVLEENLVITASIFTDPLIMVIRSCAS